MTGQWVNNESENALMCRLLVQVLLSEDEAPLHQHQNTNVLLLTLGYIVIWRYHLALFIILVVIFKQKVELNKWKSWSYTSHLKEQFICWKCTHTRAIQDVDEFDSSSDQKKCGALNHLLSNGSSAVNGCRQNESKQLIKTSQ